MGRTSGLDNPGNQILNRISSSSLSSCSTKPQFHSFLLQTDFFYLQEDRPQVLLDFIPLFDVNGYEWLYMYGFGNIEISKRTPVLQSWAICPYVGTDIEILSKTSPVKWGRTVAPRRRDRVIRRRKQQD